MSMIISNYIVVFVQLRFVVIDVHQQPTRAVYEQASSDLMTHLLSFDQKFWDLVSLLICPWLNWLQVSFQFFHF